jgi:hypothetical protein
MQGWIDVCGFIDKQMVKNQNMSGDGVKWREYARFSSQEVAILNVMIDFK